jgi:predicted alpha/beta hydrolase family esterase
VGLDVVPPRVIIIPGNGGCSPADSWYPWVERELSALGLDVLNRQFPDAVKARAQFWLPFLEELGADANTILIGHSSGAVAAMRYAETHPLLGSVLVGVCHTDLGDSFEAQSGYYAAPWQWQKIRDHQQFVAIYNSTDDPHIPISEARHVASQLKASYFEFTDRGHFLDPHLPEVVECVRRRAFRRGD